MIVKELEHNELKRILNVAQEKKAKMQEIFNFYSDWLVYLDTKKDYLIEIPYNKGDIRFVDKTSKKTIGLKLA